MIPEKAVKIMTMLGSSGYEAMLVGGCVRDMLMNRSFHDLDITTNALPEQMISVFKGFTVIPTGLKHGTVTVLIEGEPVEITTFRIDGEYSDSRRPDSVRFTANIRDDLARRDFTMNAIAMDINGNITDPFGGCDDIKSGIIRCVGEPSMRFEEDALRILRAVRFASRLGFTIEKNTSAAIHTMKERLDLVSRERVRTELDGILSGQYCSAVMREYADVIVQVIPELAACIGFDQHSPYHKYDVWEHTLHSIDACPPEKTDIRRVMLLHDIAKPASFTADEDGRGHFIRHTELGAETACGIMKRLRYDTKSIDDAEKLIRLHDEKIPDETSVKHMLSQIGERLFFMLLDVKRADNSAKNDFVLDELKNIDRIECLARDIINRGDCISLSQLAVNGTDMADIVNKPQHIGTILKKLLCCVIDGTLPNDKNALIQYAKEVSAEDEGIYPLD